jgi:hypothetical protein
MLFCLLLSQSDWSALTLAVMNREYESVKLLVEAGAEIDSKGRVRIRNRT